MSTILSKPLCVYELANNHNGDLLHGKSIIDALAGPPDPCGVTRAVKLQYRDLDTLLHPGAESPYIDRFRATRLGVDALRELAGHVRERGFRCVVTPFDETSVTRAVDDGAEVLKVASCSATDWALLEAVAATGLPVIVSTGGLQVSGIDRVYSFLRNRSCVFALMHCVPLYPTRNADLSLYCLGRMIRRYPDVPVGLSTHEGPGAMTGTLVALGLGARIFERHVGLSLSRGPKLNAYSCTPTQAAEWTDAIVSGLEAIGSERRAEEERKQLDGLERRVFASRPIFPGDEIRREDVVFALGTPGTPGLRASEFSRHRARFVATRMYGKGDAVVEKSADDEISAVREIIQYAQGALRENRIVLGPQAELEISHHYGLPEYWRFGAFLASIVNRDYCKKIILMAPDQRHPRHFHTRKEETFQVLSGSLVVELDGELHRLYAGDTLLARPGQVHGFHTLEGVIFEEISTTHYRDDSTYEDARINAADPMLRKTKVVME